MRKRPCGSVRACVCACVCVRVCNCVCGVCMLASAYVCLDFMSKYILCLRAGYSATVSSLSTRLWMRWCSPRVAQAQDSWPSCTRSFCRYVVVCVSVCVCVRVSICACVYVCVCGGGGGGGG